MIKTLTIATGFMAMLFSLFGICDGDVTGPGAEKSITITLDKIVYQKDETPLLTVENHWGTDLLLGHCGLGVGYQLEKNIDGQWITPYDIFCAAIGRPFAIAKDSVFIRNIYLYLFENSLDSIPGSYRLKLRLEEADSRELLPDSVRYTAPFTIIRN